METNFLRYYAQCLLFILFQEVRRFSFNNQTFYASPNHIIHGAKNQRVTFEVSSKEPFVHLNIYYDPEVPWHGSSDIMNMVYKISALQDSSSIELLNRLKIVSYVQTGMIRFNVI